MQEVRTEENRHRWSNALRRGWEAVAVVALGALLVIGLVVAVGLPDSRSGLRGQLLGLLVVVSVGITWVGLALNYREIRRQNVASQELLRMGVHLTGRGQAADRFMKAIEQLGDRDNLDLRIGAIYASEALARESFEVRWSLMEVLAAFVRRHCREGVEETPGGPRRLAPDVHAALTVILRRDRTRDQGRLDLSGVDLHTVRVESAQLDAANLREARLEGAWLVGAYLERADLAEARLGGADLREAHLEGANLVGARLERADLSRAHLVDADLRGAHLEGANMIGARLEGADLSEAVMQGAELTTAHLEGAHLRGAHLERANLASASLQRVNLSMAHLQGVRLFEANLEGAELDFAALEGADLRGANLKGADLSGAHLHGARLEGARLEEARVTGEQLAAAHTDESTVLPDADAALTDSPA